MLFRNRKYLVYQLHRWRAGVQEIINGINFSFRTLLYFPKIFRYRGETFKQMYILGNQALPLVIFASMFVSMVLALEWGKRLEAFGAKPMLGRMIGISVIRELGPVITGLMMAGRVGAKIVSEIGNMVLTEQVDALRAYGTDPVQRLIVPRVFAAFMVMIPLTIVADTMGILAGWFSSHFLLSVDSQFFWLSVRDGLVPKDLFIGVIKPPFFGLLIGFISSYLGFNLEGGAEGMGRAATLTVMYTSISVLLLDFLLTLIILSFY